jgi:hypothetical protein
VSIYETLANASRFAATRWRAAGLEGREEEQQRWIQVRTYGDFVRETGQVYLFEDYLKEIAPTPRPYVSNALKARQDATSQRVMALLLKAYAETPEKQPASILIHLVNFIADTGQIEDCEDYINNRLDYAPVAIAHFTTRDEAETWLKGLAEPPSPADILIGDEYYTAVYEREDNIRYISRQYIIEPYLEGEIAAEGIPPTSPSFETRAEAEEWLKNHPTSPFGFVSIAGEHYFAVHHKRLRRHTLHHVASTLTAWEEKKKALAHEQAQEAEESDGEDE